MKKSHNLWCVFAFNEGRRVKAALEMLSLSFNASFSAFYLSLAYKIRVSSYWTAKGNFSMLKVNV